MILLQYQTTLRFIALKKISKTKYNKYKNITFCTLKNYSVDVYEEALEKVSIPNYNRFNNPDNA